MSRLFFICYDKDMKFNYDWNLKDGYPAKGAEHHHHTVMSTFACGGGSSMGYKLAGYDVVAANDIDPQMARIYQENHHPKQFFLCPVKDLLTRDDLPTVDVLDGSPPCFVAGTQVLTKEGYKPIEDIQIGDYVWTHKGRFKRVYDTMNKQSDDVYAVYIEGSLPILVTGNHPFYTREMSQLKKLSEPLWKEVNDLETTKDHVGIPINKYITLQPHYICIDKCIWVPFKGKTKVEGKYTVYNISVEEDESYTVSNIAVHNCSTFSLAGSREKAWGVEKKFREGQAKQELDKLFFDFLDVAEKMQPKVVIAENVEGIIRGKAVKYVNAIVARFKKMGYNIDIFLCDGTNMGLPQMRRRVFFVANRLGKHLKLSFNEPPITFGQIRRSSGTPLRTLPYTTTQINYWHETKPGCPMGVFLAGAKKLALDKVPFTVASSSMLYDALECRTVYKEELDDISSFPHDYNYLDASPNYVQGMSVPPVMMAQVAYEVYKQLLSE